MCSNYEPVTDNDRLLASFGVTLPAGVEPAPYCSAGVMAPFIVRAEPKSPDALGEARFGLLGLLPRFATDVGFGKHTYNCRTETMKSKPAFRESWWAGRRCVIPVQLISEWNYESGRPAMWHIQRADDEPMGLAGLWSEWTSPTGEQSLSFTMLTINADGHEVFGRMNAPDHEKRMPVILPISVQERWLYGSLEDAEALLVRYPAEQLKASPREPSPKVRRATRPLRPEPELFASDEQGLAQEPVPRPARRKPSVVPPKPPELPGPTTGDLF